MPSTKQCIIAEVLDPRTSELLNLANPDDFVVSNGLISMALGQMSEEADVGPLIDDLFSEQGNEIHIKDVRLFADVSKPEALTFWEIMNRARQRCEVAIGYQRGIDVANGAPEKGVILNPVNKDERITWAGPYVEGGRSIPGDRIIVIAEEVD